MNLLVQNLIAVTLFFIFYVGLGNTFFRYVVSRKSTVSNQLNSKLEMLCSFYLGIGLWFMVATILGLLGDFNKIYISSIMIITGLICIKPTVILIRRSCTIIKNEFMAVVPESLVWKILFWLIMLLVLSGVIGLGNTALEDGAAFYLPLAKMMSYSGWLEKLPGYEGFSAVGLLGELQMATLFVFGMEEAARLIAWLCFVPVFFLLFEYAKKLELSKNATLILILCVFSSSCIFYITGGGKVDLFSGAIGLTGIFILFFESNVLLAGFLLAFACLAKLSLLIPLFPVVMAGLLGPVFFQKLTNKEKVKEFLKAGGLLAIAFLVVFAPHFVKNHIFFNNALAPFYGTKISWETSWYSEATTLQIILTYPLVWFYGGYWAQLGTLSLPVLMFLPFYLKSYFISYKNWTKQDLLLTGLILGMLLWLIIRPTFIAPRYILAILLAFAPFAAKGFDFFILKTSLYKTKHKINFVLSLIMVWTIYSLYLASKKGHLPVAAYNYVSNTTDYYCARDSHHCYVTEVLNKLAPPGSRILQLTYFTLWLRDDLLQTMLRADEFKFPPAPLSEEVWKQIYEHEFSFLYLDSVSHRESIKTYYLNNLPEWVRLEKIAEIANASAYRIIYSPSVKFSKKLKVRSEDKHWFLEKI